MFAEFQLMPPQASTVARQVDELFFFMVALTVFFTLGIAAAIAYFAFRYKRRSETEIPPNIHGSTFLELFWTIVPFIIVMVIFFWGTSIYFALTVPRDDAMDIYVVGRQWMWKIQHPTGEREIIGEQPANPLADDASREPINNVEFHVPINQPVKIIMTSEDVLHSFYIPAFRVKQDAVPGRYSTLTFEATTPGIYHLFCAEYCGTKHSRMIGQVIAMEPADFQRWRSERGESSMSVEGSKLFRKLQCITCHSGDAKAQGPNLAEIYKKTIPLANGRSIFVDDQYLRESIREPSAKIVAGFQNIMPNAYGPDKLSDEELNQVVAYIKSLKPGQILPRVEDTPTPPPTNSSPNRMEKQP